METGARPVQETSTGAVEARARFVKKRGKKGKRTNKESCRSRRSKSLGGGEPGVVRKLERRGDPVGGGGGGV